MPCQGRSTTEAGEVYETARYSTKAQAKATAALQGRIHGYPLFVYPCPSLAMGGCGGFHLTRTPPEKHRARARTKGSLRAPPKRLPMGKGTRQGRVAKALWRARHERYDEATHGGDEDTEDET